MAKQGEAIIYIICVLGNEFMDRESGFEKEMQNSVVGVISNQNGQNIQQIRLPLGRDLPTEKLNDFVDFTINVENNKKRKVLIPISNVIKVNEIFTSDDTTGKTPTDSINRGVNSEIAQNILGIAGGVVNSTSWIGRKFLEKITGDEYEPSTVERFVSADARNAENELRSMYNPNLLRETMINTAVKMVVSNSNYPQNNFDFYLQNNEINPVIASIQQEENRTQSRVLEL